MGNATSECFSECKGSSKRQAHGKYCRNLTLPKEPLSDGTNTMRAPRCHQQRHQPQRLHEEEPRFSKGHPTRKMRAQRAQRIPSLELSTEWMQCSSELLCSIDALPLDDAPPQVISNMRAARLSFSQPAARR